MLPLRMFLQLKMCTTKLTTPYIKQIWVSSAVLINVMGQGMVLGYPACLLPALMAPDSPIPTTIGDASWLASVTGISNMLGVLLSSIYMDIFGRRWAFILDIIPSIIGWSLLWFGTNIPTLMIGRVLNGVSGGGTIILGAIIIGEYTCPKIRGVLLNFKTTVMCFGCMGVHFIGNYYHWRTVAAIALVPQFVALIMTWTWPESPAWLASKEQYEKCEQEYYWLRGTSNTSKNELSALIHAQKEKLTRLTEKKNIYVKFCDFIQKFTKKDFTKPIAIITLAGVLSESSGRHIFPTYTREIIYALTSDTNLSFYYTMMIDLIVTTGAFFACFLIKFISRRTMLFCTGVPSVIIVCLICLYRHLVFLNILSDVGNWLTISSFIVFFLLSNMGCTLIPYILLGEILPLSHRAAGTTVVAFIVSVFIMIGVKAAPYMFISVKVHGTFGIFGIIMGLSLMLLYFMLPETKDRTLQEIEDYFNYGDYKKRACDFEESKSVAEVI